MDYSKITQTKQIETSKDTMKDCQPDDKFCCLKNKLIQTRIAK